MTMLAPIPRVDDTKPKSAAVLEGLLAQSEEKRQNQAANIHALTQALQKALASNAATTKENARLKDGLARVAQEQADIAQPVVDGIRAKFERELAQAQARIADLEQRYMPCYAVDGSVRFRLAEAKEWIYQHLVQRRDGRHLPSIVPVPVPVGVEGAFIRLLRPTLNARSSKGVMVTNASSRDADPAILERFGVYCGEVEVPSEPAND